MVSPKVIDLKTKLLSRFYFQFIKIFTIAIIPMAQKCQLLSGLHKCPSGSWNILLSAKQVS